MHGSIARAVLQAHLAMHAYCLLRSCPQLSLWNLNNILMYLYLTIVLLCEFWDCRSHVRVLSMASKTFHALTLKSMFMHAAGIRGLP